MESHRLFYAKYFHRFDHLDGSEGPLFYSRPHVYSAVGSERLFLLETINEIDPVSLNYEFPNDWHYKWIFLYD